MHRPSRHSKHSLHIEFVVLFSCSHDVILGWDFLSNHNAVIDCARAEVEFCSQNDGPFPDTSPTCGVKLVVEEEVDIPPQSSVLVALSDITLADGPVLFTPSYAFISRKNVPLLFAILTLLSGRTTMFVYNRAARPFSLLGGETVGNIEHVDSVFSLDVSDDARPLPLNALASPGATDTPPSDDVFQQSIAADLEPTQRTELLALLRKFQSSFDCKKTPLGRTSTVTHHIDTGTHMPLRQRPYRVSAPERSVISEHVDDML